MRDWNAIYYRLYRNRDDKPVVVCMQWFDEFDYDQLRFINDIEYETEKEATQALNAILYSPVIVIVMGA